MTRGTVQMTVFTVLVALAMTFNLQRVAQASDTGKIVGAVVAGIIVYEILDDDDAGPCWQRRPVWYSPHKSTYDYRYRGYYNGPGYGPPVCYRKGHGQSDIHVDVHRGPHGHTSVDLRYRHYGW
ncbi:MAG: hypothetical protein ACUVX8_05555 [Candidatus Zipacnadales bacterium]